MGTNRRMRQGTNGNSNIKTRGQTAIGTGGHKDTERHGPKGLWGKSGTTTYNFTGAEGHRNNRAQLHITTRGQKAMWTDWHDDT